MRQPLLLDYIVTKQRALMATSKCLDEDNDMDHVFLF